MKPAMKKIEERRKALEAAFSFFVVEKSIGCTYHSCGGIPQMSRAHDRRATSRWLCRARTSL